MEVGIQDILLARDARAERQKVLLARYPVPLICFTMNIPGSVKDSDLIRRGFSLGLQWLRAQLQGEGISVAHFEESREYTGCTAFFSVDAPAEKVKKLTVEIEDHAPVGRLFDMDVLTPEGRKISREELGAPRRKCLICENDAAVCGRSRAHSVDRLREKTDQLLWDAVRKAESEEIARIAVKSLLYEVCTTPKPGLVDRLNNGSHKDMDLFTFSAGISALFPYFAACAGIGMETAEKDPAETFQKLRFPGKQAESAMFAATGGVNTHKGAIFSMGILCAAAGRLWEKDPAPNDLPALCGEMTRGVTAEIPHSKETAGKRLYEKYGITGIRGQAEQGFPLVSQVGLPALETGLQMGKTLNDAGCGALLAMIARGEDTNMLHRSDPQTRSAMAEKVGRMIQENPYPGAAALTELDRLFREKNLSPGGCADLLAMCYFLHFLRDR